MFLIIISFPFLSSVRCEGSLCRPVYVYDLGVFWFVPGTYPTGLIWAYFVHLHFQDTKTRRKKKKKKKKIINISRRVLWFVCFPVRNMLSSGFLVARVCLATSHCRSLGFYIAFCVVSALNSRASQSVASVSAEKYKGLPFFLKAMLKLFSD